MKTNQPAWINIIIIIAGLIIIVAGMRAASTILVPFLLSIFFAIMCAPPLIWLKEKGLPTAIAIIMIMFSVTGVGLILIVVIGSSLNDFSSSLPFYETRLTDELVKLKNWLLLFGIDISEQVLKKVFNPEEIIQIIVNMLSGLGNMLTNAFLITLTVFFILAEAINMPTKLRIALNNPEKTSAFLKKFTRSVNRYLAIKSTASLITGLLVAGLLLFLKIDYPFLWGLLAFVLNYIPNIGSIISAFPTMLIGLIQFGYYMTFYVGLGYLVINIVIGGIVEPRFTGKGLGLSTLVVFISLVFWGWILGPVGMFLSVPLTMIIKIALESNERTWWIAILLGSEESSKATLLNKYKLRSSQPFRKEVL